MKKSCGIIVILNEKILLCHPTNSRWEGTYGVPKGKVEEGEEEIDCAVREFFEETGIKIDKEKLNTCSIIPYSNYQTGDIYYVQRFLGHKSILNTRIYIDLRNAYFQKGDEEFICRVATTIKEAEPLIVSGFEYVCEIGGARMFRKRK